jgi:hypothetical protein
MKLTSWWNYIEACRISEIHVQWLLLIELGNLPVNEVKFMFVGICHSGKTRHDNSIFHIIGNDDLDTW